VERFATVEEPSLLILGVDDKAINSILKFVAPALGWR
jgi:hypothetical protein